MRFARMWKPFLETFLEDIDEDTLLDVGSGEGNILPQIISELQEKDRRKVILSDLYPDYTAVRRLTKARSDRVIYYPSAVNASEIPPYLSYPRVFVNSFHHFAPEAASRILRDSLDQGQSLLILEYVRRSFLAHLLFLVFGFLYCYLFFPFYRRKTVGMFFLTYILPVIPIMTVWDGIVSNLRSYEKEEIEELLPKRWRGKARVKYLFKRHMFYPTGITGFIIEPDTKAKSVIPAPHLRLAGKSRCEVGFEEKKEKWKSFFEEGQDHRLLVKENATRAGMVRVRRQGIGMNGVRIDGRDFEGMWVNAVKPLGRLPSHFVVVFDYFGEHLEENAQIDVGCIGLSSYSTRILKSENGPTPRGRWVPARIEYAIRRNADRRWLVDEKRYWDKNTFFHMEHDYGDVDDLDFQLRIAGHSGIITVSNLQLFSLTA